MISKKAGRSFVSNLHKIRIISYWAFSKSLILNVLKHINWKKLLNFVIASTVFFFMNSQISYGNNCCIMTWQSCDFNIVILLFPSITFFLRFELNPSGNRTDFRNSQNFLLSFRINVYIACDFIQRSPSLYKCNFLRTPIFCKSILALFVSLLFYQCSKLCPTNYHKHFSRYAWHLNCDVTTMRSNKVIPKRYSFSSNKAPSDASCASYYHIFHAYQAIWI